MDTEYASFGLIKSKKQELSTDIKMPQQLVRSCSFTDLFQMEDLQK